MKARWKRSLAMLLVVSMMLTLVPVTSIGVMAQDVSAVSEMTAAAAEPADQSEQSDSAQPGDEAAETAQSTDWSKLFSGSEGEKKTTLRDKVKSFVSDLLGAFSPALEKFAKKAEKQAPAQKAEEVPAEAPKVQDFMQMRAGDIDFSTISNKQAAAEEAGAQLFDTTMPEYALGIEYGTGNLVLEHADSSSQGKYLVYQVDGDTREKAVFKKVQLAGADKDGWADAYTYTTVATDTGSESVYALFADVALPYGNLGASVYYCEGDAEPCSFMVLNYASADSLVTSKKGYETGYTELTFTVGEGYEYLVSRKIDAYLIDKDAEWTPCTTAEPHSVSVDKPSYVWVREVGRETDRISWKRSIAVADVNVKTGSNVAVGSFAKAMPGDRILDALRYNNQIEITGVEWQKKDANGDYQPTDESVFAMNADYRAMISFKPRMGYQISETGGQISVVVANGDGAEYSTIDAEKTAGGYQAYITFPRTLRTLEKNGKSVGNMGYAYRGVTSFDVHGRLESTGAWKKSTFYDGGFYSYAYVGENVDVNYNEARMIYAGRNGDNLYETELNGLKFSVEVVPVVGGDLMQVQYTVKNDSGSTKTFSLGSGADVMIGANDCAEIMRKTDGQSGDNGAIGVVMYESKDHTDKTKGVLNLWARRTPFVTDVDSLWFGYWSSYVGEWSWAGGNSARVMFTGEDHCGPVPGDNGYEGYDSAMAWGWKDRVIKPGATTTFSVVLGVGENISFPSVRGGTFSALTNSDRNVSVFTNIAPAYGQDNSVYFTKKDAEVKVIRYGVGENDTYKTYVDIYRNDTLLTEGTHYTLETLQEEPPRQTQVTFKKGLVEYGDSLYAVIRNAIVSVDSTEMGSELEAEDVKVVIPNLLTTPINSFDLSIPLEVYRGTMPVRSRFAICETQKDDADAAEKAKFAADAQAVSLGETTILGKDEAGLYQNQDSLKSATTYRGLVVVDTDAKHYFSGLYSDENGESTVAVNTIGKTTEKATVYIVTKDATVVTLDKDGKLVNAAEAAEGTVAVDQGVTVYDGQLVVAYSFTTESVGNEVNYTLYLDPDGRAYRAKTIYNATGKPYFVPYSYEQQFLPDGAMCEPYNGNVMTAILEPRSFYTHVKDSDKIDLTVDPVGKTLSFDSDSETWTMENLSFSTTQKVALYFSDAAKLNVKGTNLIQSVGTDNADETNSYGIMVGGLSDGEHWDDSYGYVYDLTIEGTGKLTVLSADSTKCATLWDEKGYSTGILAYDLSIRGVDLTVYSGEVVGGVSNGIVATNLYMYDGKLTAISDRRSGSCYGISAPNLKQYGGEIYAESDSGNNSEDSGSAIGETSICIFGGKLTANNLNTQATDFGVGRNGSSCYLSADGAYHITYSCDDRLTRERTYRTLPVGTMDRFCLGKATERGSNVDAADRSKIFSKYFCIEFQPGFESMIGREVAVEKQTVGGTTVADSYRTYYTYNKKNPVNPATGLADGNGSIYFLGWYDVDGNVLPAVYDATGESATEPVIPAPENKLYYARWASVDTDAEVIAQIPVNSGMLGVDMFDGAYYYNVEDGQFYKAVVTYRTATEEDARDRRVSEGDRVIESCMLIPVDKSDAGVYGRYSASRLYDRDSNFLNELLGNIQGLTHQTPDKQLDNFIWSEYLVLHLKDGFRIDARTGSNAHDFGIVPFGFTRNELVSEKYQSVSNGSDTWYRNSSILRVSDMENIDQLILDVEDGKAEISAVIAAIGTNNTEVYGAWDWRERNYTGTSVTGSGELSIDARFATVGNLLYAGSGALNLKVDNLYDVIDKARGTVPSICGTTTVSIDYGEGSRYVEQGLSDAVPVVCGTFSYLPGYDVSYTDNLVGRDSISVKPYGALTIDPDGTIKLGGKPLTPAAERSEEPAALYLPKTYPVYDDNIYLVADDTTGTASLVFRSDPTGDMVKLLSNAPIAVSLADQDDPTKAVVYTVGEDSYVVTTVSGLADIYNFYDGETAYGIYSPEDMTVNGGFYVEVGHAENCYGIYSGGDLTVASADYQGDERSDAFGLIYEFARIADCYIEKAYTQDPTRPTIYELVSGLLQDPYYQDVIGVIAPMINRAFYPGSNVVTGANSATARIMAEYYLNDQIEESIDLTEINQFSYFTLDNIIDMVSELAPGLPALLSFAAAYLPEMIRVDSDAYDMTGKNNDYIADRGALQGILTLPAFRQSKLAYSFAAGENLTIDGKNAASGAAYACETDDKVASAMFYADGQFSNTVGTRVSYALSNGNAINASSVRLDNLTVDVLSGLDDNIVSRNSKIEAINTYISTADQRKDKLNSAVVGLGDTLMEILNSIYFEDGTLKSDHELYEIAMTHLPADIYNTPESVQAIIGYIQRFMGKGMSAEAILQESGISIDQILNMISQILSQITPEMIIEMLPSLFSAASSVLDFVDELYNQVTGGFTDASFASLVYGFAEAMFDGSEEKAYDVVAIAKESGLLIYDPNEPLSSSSFDYFDVSKVNDFVDMLIDELLDGAVVIDEQGNLHLSGITDILTGIVPRLWSNFIWYDEGEDGVGLGFKVDENGKLDENGTLKPTGMRATNSLRRMGANRFLSGSTLSADVFDPDYKTYSETVYGFGFDNVQELRNAITRVSDTLKDPYGFWFAYNEAEPRIDSFNYAVYLISTLEFTSFVSLCAPGAASVKEPEADKSVFLTSVDGSSKYTFCMVAAEDEKGEIVYHNGADVTINTPLTDALGTKIKVPVTFHYDTETGKNLGYDVNAAFRGYVYGLGIYYTIENDVMLVDTLEDFNVLTAYEIDGDADVIAQARSDFYNAAKAADAIFDDVNGKTSYKSESRTMTISGELEDYYATWSNMLYIDADSADAALAGVLGKDSQVSKDNLANMLMGLTLDENLPVKDLIDRYTDPNYAERAPKQGESGGIEYYFELAKGMLPEVFDSVSYLIAPRSVIIMSDEATDKLTSGYISADNIVIDGNVTVKARTTGMEYATTGGKLRSSYIANAHSTRYLDTTYQRIRDNILLNFLVDKIGQVGKAGIVGEMIDNIVSGMTGGAMSVGKLFDYVLEHITMDTIDNVSTLIRGDGGYGMNTLDAPEIISGAISTTGKSLKNKAICGSMIDSTLALVSRVVDAVNNSGILGTRKITFEVPDVNCGQIMTTLFGSTKGAVELRSGNISIDLNQAQTLYGAPLNGIEGGSVKLGSGLKSVKVFNAYAPYEMTMFDDDFFYARNDERLMIPAIRATTYGIMAENDKLNTAAIFGSDRFVDLSVRMTERATEESVEAGKHTYVVQGDTAVVSAPFNPDYSAYVMTTAERAEEKSLFSKDAIVIDTGYMGRIGLNQTVVYDGEAHEFVFNPAYDVKNGPTAEELEENGYTIWYSPIYDLSKMVLNKTDDVTSIISELLGSLAVNYTTEKPTAAGKYVVKITREEDANFAALDTSLGLRLSSETVDGFNNHVYVPYSTNNVRFGSYIIDNGGIPMTLTIEGTDVSIRMKDLLMTEEEVSSLEIGNPIPGGYYTCDLDTVAPGCTLTLVLYEADQYYVYLTPVIYDADGEDITEAFTLRTTEGSKSFFDGCIRAPYYILGEKEKAQTGNKFGYLIEEGLFIEADSFIATNDYIPDLAVQHSDGTTALVDDFDYDTYSNDITLYTAGYEDPKDPTYTYARDAVVLPVEIAKYMIGAFPSTDAAFHDGFDRVVDNDELFDVQLVVMGGSFVAAEYSMTYDANAFTRVNKDGSALETADVADDNGIVTLKGRTAIKTDEETPYNDECEGEVLATYYFVAKNENASMLRKAFIPAGRVTREFRDAMTTASEPMAPRASAVNVMPSYDLELVRDYAAGRTIALIYTTDENAVFTVDRDVEGRNERLMCLLTDTDDGLNYEYEYSYKDAVTEETIIKGNHELAKSVSANKGKDDKVYVFAAYMIDADVTLEDAIKSIGCFDMLNVSDARTYLENEKTIRFDDGFKFNEEYCAEKDGSHRNQQYNVNGYKTGSPTVDLNDAAAAKFVYNSYQPYFEADDQTGDCSYIDIILKADVNRDKTVDTGDVNEIFGHYVRYPERPV